MPITPINNFKNIMDALLNKIRTEFGNTLPAYVAHETKNVSSQYLKLQPVSDTLLEYATFSETREYALNMLYYSNTKDIEKVKLENVMRVVARIEALIHDNIVLTLSDGSKAYDCRIETSEYNTEEEEEKYVVTMTFNCKHLGNVA